MLCTGCSAAWVSTIDSILAAAAPALVNILQIVAVADGGPADSELSAKINTDANAIKTLAADFAEASAMSSPGVCQQLQSAISTYQGDQQTVFEIAQVGDANTQSKITLLADLVGGTVTAITALIPSCQDAKLTPRMDGGKILNISTFATYYNSILVAKTGNAAVDAATPKMKLREHPKLVRWATFGRLQ
jgi:hypothetical protein